MAAAIGTSTCGRSGAEQGLAPVLDVVRDPRWGRTEETIGEDPNLVGTIGTAYVQGLQAAGVDATPSTSPCIGLPSAGGTWRRCRWASASSRM